MKEELIALIMKRTYSRKEYAEQLVNEILEICETKTDSLTQ